MKISSLKSLSLAAVLSVGAIAGFSYQVESKPATSHEVVAEKADKVVRASKINSNNTAFLNKRNGVAIKGTDPVAYFTQGRPVAGSSSFTYSWNGATWRFSSAANRDKFAANPTAYAPQYGGYCAWAISQGYTADIDPSAWKIVNGKLYLNANKSIQRRWEGNQSTFISQANQKWPSISGGR